jgi:hypothetical protein
MSQSEPNKTKPTSILSPYANTGRDNHSSPIPAECEAFSEVHQQFQSEMYHRHRKVIMRVIVATQDDVVFENYLAAF